MALLPKGQREQSLVLVCLLAVVAIGAYWHFVYTPKAADLAKQKEHLETLQSQNQRAKAELAHGSVAQLKTQLAQYERTLALVRTLVPASNEVPALLEQVSTAARRVGLDIASVDPQPVVQGTSYDTYQYGISVLGGYHALGAFLSNVGSLTRIVLPANVQLTLATNPAATKGRATPSSAVIQARFDLQTFVVPKLAVEAAGDAAPAQHRGAGAN